MLSPSPRLLSPGEEVRAEFFMEELNNGVKLCELIGALQAKVALSCPSALCKVSQLRARVHLVMYCCFPILHCTHKEFFFLFSCLTRGRWRSSAALRQVPSLPVTTPPTFWPGAATSVWRRPTCLSQRASVRTNSTQFSYRCLYFACVYVIHITSH